MSPSQFLSLFGCSTAKTVLRSQIPKRNPGFQPAGLRALTDGRTPGRANADRIALEKSSQTPVDQPNPWPMPWPEYLALKKQQRQYALIATIPSTTIGLFLGVSHFATIESLPTDLLFGLEANYVYAIATFGCAMVGYLVGPVIGHSIFRLRISKAVQQAMQERNAQFYARIKSNRVDPSQSNLNNPLPDWHGERVGSLRDYRRWLRDQAAYRRKASQHGMLLKQEDLTQGKDLM